MALERKTLLETKNRTLKCLKRHYSTVQSMKNVAALTEDRAFSFFFRPRRGEFDSSRVPTTPGNLPSKAQKNANARGSAWAQLELTDALSFLMYSITVLCKTLSFCPLVILCFSKGFSPNEWVSSYSLEIEVRSSNNDNACLISSFFLIAYWTFSFSYDILYYTSNQLSEKEMFSLFCVSKPRFSDFSSYPDWPVTVLSNFSTNVTFKYIFLKSLFSLIEGLVWFHLYFQRFPVWGRI